MKEIIEKEIEEQENNFKELNETISDKSIP